MYARVLCSFPTVNEPNMHCQWGNEVFGFSTIAMLLSEPHNDQMPQLLLLGNSTTSFECLTQFVLAWTKRKVPAFSSVCIISSNPWKISWKKNILTAIHQANLQFMEKVGCKCLNKLSPSFRMPQSVLYMASPLHYFIESADLNLLQISRATF